MSDSRKRDGGHRIVQPKDTIEVVNESQNETVESKQLSEFGNEPGNDFKRPRGQKTRRILAKHQARKLKVDDNMPNLEANYLQSLGEEDLDNNGVQHWQNLIYQSRHITVVAKSTREKRLTSE